MIPSETLRGQRGGAPAAMQAGRRAGEGSRRAGARSPAATEEDGRDSRERPATVQQGDAVVSVPGS